MIQFLNAATGTATTAEMLMSFLPMILIIVFMIVLIYLPQKRQDKKDAAMRNSIEIGDKVTTIGGVIPPNGELMEIVPVDDHLLIETRLSPRDIAFIHPNQEALVKITAYDYAIYGGLEGEVTMISPDTLQDEVKRDVYYYRVYIRTDSNHLTNKQGQEFPVFPGMIATVDIKTGSKTILDYLLKPLNKAKEALRER